LAAFHGSVILKKRNDYYQFVPFKKKEQFTARELGERAEIDAAIARKTLYVLTKTGLVERIGKLRNAIVYRRK
jgi:ribosomal protein S25